MKKNNENTTEITLSHLYSSVATDSNGFVSANLLYPQIGIPIGTPVYFEDKNNVYLVGEIDSYDDHNNGVWVNAKISYSFLYGKKDDINNNETMMKASEELREKVMEKITEAVLGKGYTSVSYYHPSFIHTETTVTIKHDDGSEET